MEEKTARAAVCIGPNQPFQLRRYPLRPVRSGEVRVRVRLATICGSDVHSYCGHRPNPFPGILGHETVGTIEALGSDLTRDLKGEKLAPGDRVTWTLFAPSEDAYFSGVLDMPQKSRGLRKYGHESVEQDPPLLGGFAEYCYLLPGTGILRLPDTVSDEVAAPLNCGVATMVAVTEAGGIGLGDRVVIQGLGLLGLYGCAIAKARGAQCVIAIDGCADRRQRAQAFGADICLSPGDLAEDDLIDTVNAACPPDGADVGIEVCGVAQAVPAGLKMLRTGGRYVMAGLVSPGSAVTLEGNDLVRRMLHLRGVHNYHPRHLVQALDFVVAHRDRFPLAELVGARFGLDAIDAAIAAAAGRSVVRAAIDPWASPDGAGGAP